METNISKLILVDREKRYNEMLGLLKEYALPVLCGKLNYPGSDKNTAEAKRAFGILTGIIEDRLSDRAVFSKELTGYDGRSILMVLGLPPDEIKKITVEIEDACQLGRIFDLDVYVGDGSSIGREEVGMPQRKCILCDENARVCVRARRHSMEEILKKINQIINNYGEQHGN